MRKLMIVFLTVISFSASGQEQKDCSPFKKGNFSYVNDSSQTVEVERRGRYQIERNSKTGEVNKFTIKWTGDCEYQIKQFAANRKETKKKNGQVIKVKITKVYNDRYDYTCACPTDGSIPNVSGTMIKVQ